LDLFCGVGGASRGYADAGFDVTGVDRAPQPNYPYPFHQADAITFLIEHWREFDAIHASPPCQSSTALTKGTNKGREYPNLIPATRALFKRLPLPTVIENVEGSDLRRDLILCGEMFDLGVIRHRYFELSWSVPQPAHFEHRGRVAGWRKDAWYEGPYFAVYGKGGGKGSVAEWQQAMGIDWTDVRTELAEAIPPAYTEYVGTHLLARIRMVA
jgi:hypothetical protein